MNERLGAVLSPLAHASFLEHERIPIRDTPSGDAVTAAEAEALLDLAVERPGFVERGPGYLQLAQYCGVVRIGERILEVLPKVGGHGSPEDCRGVLIRLLTKAGYFKTVRMPGAAQRLRHGSLLEVFIGAFLDAVSSIIRGGLLQQYCEHQDELPVIRGALVLHENIRRLSGRFDKVVCRYDELTYDNTWNRAIKAGLREVRPFVVTDSLTRKWNDLFFVFEDVADQNFTPQALRHLVGDRQVARYQEAIEWVRWILARVTPGIRAGDKRSPGLLIDMNLLFQDVVQSWLETNVQAPNFTVTSQEQTLHLGVARPTNRPAFSLRPDFVLRNRGVAVAVADAKWKKVAFAAGKLTMPHEDDVYQMYTYASVYKVPYVVLIYPAYGRVAEASPTSFQLASTVQDSTRLAVVCLDVYDDALPVIGRSRTEVEALFGLPSRKSECSQL